MIGTRIAFWGLTSGLLSHLAISSPFPGLPRVPIQVLSAPGQGIPETCLFSHACPLPSTLRPHSILLAPVNGTADLSSSLNLDTLSSTKRDQCSFTSLFHFSQSPCLGTRLPCCLLLAASRGVRSAGGVGHPIHCADATFLSHSHLLRSRPRSLRDSTLAAESPLLSHQRLQHHSGGCIP